MPKVDVLQIRISSAAIGGLVVLLVDFNVKVFKTMVDITNRTLPDTAAENTIKRERKRRIRRIEEEKEEEKEEAIRRIEEEKEEEIRRRKEEEKEVEEKTD